MKLTASLLLASLATIFTFSPSQAATISCIACEGGSIDFYLGTPLFDNDPGGLPAQADELQVFLDSATGVTSFTGNVGSQSGQPETLATTDVPVDVANGFANVKPTDTDNKASTKEKIGSLTFSVPGYLFGDFLFDVQLDEFGSGSDKVPFPLSIIAYDKDASSLGSWTFGLNDIDLKANADLSFLVLSSISNIDNVVITSLYQGLKGMQELKHFQVSELLKRSSITPTVPLPAALPLLAAGLGVLGYAARLRSKQKNPAAA